MRFMNFPIRFFLFFAILQIQLTSFSQQELGLNFTTSLIQSSETNPSFISSDKFVLTLPSLYLNYYNSSFPIKNLGEINNKVLTFSPDKAINNLSKTDNIIKANTNLSLISFAFRIKDLQFRIFHNSNFDLHANYPKKFLEFIWNGNEPFIGNEIEIAPKIDLMAYHEFGIGFATQFNEKLSVGTNLKYLIGLVSIKTQKAQASLFTSSEVYQLSAQTDLSFYSSGLSAFLDGSSDDLIVYENKNNWILNQNSGLAIDLGFEYQVSESVSIAGSVLDLGFINWRESAIEQYSKGDFTFDGVVVEPFNENDDYDFKNVLDSIDNLVDFQSSIIENGFKTQLPVRYYLSGIWELNPTLYLGALTYGEIYRGNFSPAFAINAQKKLGQVFEFGGVVSIYKNAVPNFGLNISLRLAGIQIYGLSDNVIPLFDYTNGRHFNLRFGLNIAIKGKEKEEEPIDEELIAMEENSSAEESIPEDSTEKKEEKKKKEKGSKKLKNSKSIVVISQKKEYFRRTDKY